MNTGQKLYHVIFETAAGWMALCGSDRGLSRVTFPYNCRKMASTYLGLNIDRGEYSESHFEDLIEIFKKYFEGQPVEFNTELDLSQATPFERKVWESTRTIPFGETRSYSWVAQQIGQPQAPRAVGQALRRNPLPIVIPCHRVLASDGNLRGFGGGLAMKEFLLQLEKNCLISH